MSAAEHDEILAELAGAASGAWAILPERASALSGIIADAALGKDVSPSRLGAALAAVGESRRDTSLIQSGRDGGMVAVVPAHGIALYKRSYPGLAFSTRRLALTMDELAADRSVSRIVIDFDSPGGMVTGTPEAGEAIWRARQAKPVQAVVNPLAASAAYWLASQAGQVIVNPSGDVGSIGVFLLHVSIARALEMEGVDPTFIFAGPRKVDGNMFQQLSDRARADAQTEVDVIYADFLKTVARGRGKSAATVERDFGQGRTVMARDALKVGMVDRIGTLEEMIAGAGRGTPATVGAADRRTPPRSSSTDDAAARRRRRLALLREG